MTNQELENRFTYRRPIGNQPQRYEALRSKAKELAALGNALCPESREKANAFTQLEDAVMWFNAAIARNENESTSTITSVELPQDQAQFEQQMAAWKKLPADERIARLAGTNWDAGSTVRGEVKP